MEKKMENKEEVEEVKEEEGGGVTSLAGGFHFTDFALKKFAFTSNLDKTIICPSFTLKFATQKSGRLAEKSIMLISFLRYIITMCPLKLT